MPAIPATCEAEARIKKSSLRPGAVAHACNPSTLEAKVVDHLRSGVRDQPGQYDETLSLRKMQKLAGHGVLCL